MNISDTLIDKHKKHWGRLEKGLGYHFIDARYLLGALTHRSFVFEQGNKSLIDNEVLEFLGDAVLDLVLGDRLISIFPELREGELTKFRSALVNENHLAVMAQTIELGRYLLLGKGEETTNGREKASILASAYEAIVGAVFKDGGYEAVAEVICKQFSPWLTMEKQALLVSDFKSTLQELVQGKYNEPPEYVVEHEEGPDHNKKFTVSVRFRGKLLASGTAGSKKEAEQRAAAVAVKNFVTFDF